jgi:nucleoside-diphosphate-sugar epimerase
MNVCVVGAKGYVGRRLATRFLEEGDVRLRLLVADVRTVSGLEGIPAEVFEGDLGDRQSLARAVRGCDVVYFPIRYFLTDRAIAEQALDITRQFRDVCIEEGVKRIVYVGSFEAQQAKNVLTSDADAIGEVLCGRPDRIQTIWLRAGAFIGSGSATFEILRNLVQKFPLLPMPRWTDASIDFLSVADLVEYLVRARTLSVPGNATIPIGAGPMPFREMVRRTAQGMGLRRVIVPVPVTVPRFSAFLLTLATPLSWGLASYCLHILQSPDRGDSANGSARRLFPGITPLTFEEAMRRSLEDLEHEHVISRWSDSLAGISFKSSEEDLARAMFRDRKEMTIGDLPPRKIFRAVESIGGKRGWFAFDLLWRIRGLLDKLAGGYGTSMGRRVESDLRIGDMLDVWKVVDLREDERLLLEAQMKVFGKAWLEFRIEGDLLVQTAYHYPKGLLGRLYWYSMLPFHIFIFKDMIRTILSRAREID